VTIKDGFRSLVAVDFWLARSKYSHPMATVSHFQYSLSGVGLPVGAAHTWTWGPWPWAIKGVLVTAHPFDLSNANRAMTVTDVQLRTTPNQPVGDKWVRATIRNVGADNIGIYNIALDVIAP
jgi:hypothetical protein